MTEAQEQHAASMRLREAGRRIAELQRRRGKLSPEDRERFFDQVRADLATLRGKWPRSVRLKNLSEK